jgi:hypothetical protein
MNITDKQIKELTTALGVEKLKQIIPNLPEPFDRNKIYIYKSLGDIYKLHCVNHHNDEYAFILLENSSSYASGQSSPESQIEYAGEKLYTFDTLEEFVDWISQK